jgi:homocitrate synthase
VSILSPRFLHRTLANTISLSWLDFGLSRYIEIGSRLTGWNAVKSRVEQLELDMTDDQVKDVTAKIKQLADVKTQSMDDVDTVLRVCRSPPFLPRPENPRSDHPRRADHRGITTGHLKLRQPEVFDELLASHKSEQGSDAEDGPAKKKVKTNGN